MWGLVWSLAAVSEQSVLQKQLSVREDPPSCEELARQHDNIEESLQKLIDPDIFPAYVPMRAANCLLILQPSEVELYRQWMIDPHSKGLAYLVVDKMPDLPVDSAVKLARAGLEGVHAESLKIRLKSTDIPEIRQVLQDIQSQETEK